MMTRVGIDLKWTGGSIRMAATSKALDGGLEPAHYAGGEVAIVRDVECILQSFMLPTRKRPHFCFGHRLAHLFVASARFFACSASQLLAGPPMFGPKSIIPRMSRLRDKHLGLLQKLAS